LFRAHLVAATIVLVAAIWLSSGTMAPYAATWPGSPATEPCHYLVNIDHAQFQATWLMLDGAPRDQWIFSVVLRRILFPLVAFPFMKLWGFDLGGFFASLLIHVAAMVVLALGLRRRDGEGVAIAGMWLLATYPGVTYWAALPYSYVAIVPASIGLYFLLESLADEIAPRRAAWLGLGMGVLFTAYDLLPIFGVAALLMLTRARRWGVLAATLPGMIAPSVVVILALRLIGSVPAQNGNTDIYGTVARAWLHPGPIGAWLALLKDFPRDAIANYLFANFIFLPAVFLVLVVRRRHLHADDAAILLATALVFLFNNLAPPYPGKWQMRGQYIPRLYQPMFVVLLCYTARAAHDRLGRWLCIFAIVANATVAFGPVARVPWAGQVYHRFYLHAPEPTMDAMLAKWGRRPLGFCLH
jgi:hypothetical protein